MPIKKRLFDMGQQVSTPGAMAHLQAHGIDYQNLLDRHSTGDWGDIGDEDKLQNQHGLDYAERLMSVYQIKGATPVWVITEWDRSVTTILLPDEY